MPKLVFGDKIMTKTQSFNLEVTIISKSHFSWSILFKSLIMFKTDSKSQLKVTMFVA